MAQLAPVKLSGCEYLVCDTWFVQAIVPVGGLPVTAELSRADPEKTIVEVANTATSAMRRYMLAPVRPREYAGPVRMRHTNGVPSVARVSGGPVPVPTRAGS